MVARLNRSFFARSTLEVARELLGQNLVKQEPDGQRIAGLICETEAYVGVDDDACHASSGRTVRNQSMWGLAGHAYVFFTYGMHWMLNVVTEVPALPAAVLIRGIFPSEGLDRIQSRRVGRPQRQWTDGPAKLCQALKINGAHDGMDLCHQDSIIFIEQAEQIPDSSVTIGPRVGLNRVAEPWKSIPWRYQVAYDYFLARGGV